jgi:hypothetical protein
MRPGFARVLALSAIIFTLRVAYVFFSLDAHGPFLVAPQLRDLGRSGAGATGATATKPRALGSTACTFDLPGALAAGLNSTQAGLAQLPRCQFQFSTCLVGALGAGRNAAALRDAALLSSLTCGCVPDFIDCLESDGCVMGDLDQMRAELAANCPVTAARVVGGVVAYAGASVAAGAAATSSAGAPAGAGSSAGASLGLQVVVDLLQHVSATGMAAPASAPRFYKDFASAFMFSNGAIRLPALALAAQGLRVALGKGERDVPGAPAMLPAVPPGVVTNPSGIAAGEYARSMGVPLSDVFPYSAVLFTFLLALVALGEAVVMFLERRRPAWVSTGDAGTRWVVRGLATRIWLTLYSSTTIMCVHQLHHSSSAGLAVWALVWLAVFCVMAPWKIFVLLRGQLDGVWTLAFVPRSDGRGTDWASTWTTWCCGCGARARQDVRGSVARLEACLAARAAATAAAAAAKKEDIDDSIADMEPHDEAEPGGAGPRQPALSPGKVSIVTPATAVEGLPQRPGVAVASSATQEATAAPLPTPLRGEPDARTLNDAAMDERRTVLGALVCDYALGVGWYGFVVLGFRFVQAIVLEWVKPIPGLQITLLWVLELLALWALRTIAPYQASAWTQRVQEALAASRCADYFFMYFMLPTAPDALRAAGGGIVMANQIVAAVVTVSMLVIRALRAVPSALHRCRSARVATAAQDESDSLTAVDVAADATRGSTTTGPAEMPPRPPAPAPGPAAPATAAVSRDALRHPATTPAGPAPAGPLAAASPSTSAPAAAVSSRRVVVPAPAGAAAAAVSKPAAAAVVAGAVPGTRVADAKPSGSSRILTAAGPVPAAAAAAGQPRESSEPRRRSSVDVNGLLDEFDKKS